MTVAAAAVAIALALASCSAGRAEDDRARIGDPERGRIAAGAHGCGTCHVIPEVAFARGGVGPPLTHWAKHVYIAGELPNEPETLVRYLLDPPALVPGTAMPAMGLSERDARDIAAFLYRLD